MAKKKSPAKKKRGTSSGKKRIHEKTSKKKRANTPGRRKAVPKVTRRVKPAKGRKPKKAARTVRAKVSKRQPKEKVVTAPPINYNNEELSRLRKLVRKPDGTFLTRADYEMILQRVKDTRDELTDVLQELESKLPEGVRAIAESEDYALYFQIGQMTEKIASVEEEDTAEEQLSDRPTITIIDLWGDEHNLTSASKAQKIINLQTRVLSATIRAIAKSAEATSTDKNAAKKIETAIYVAILERKKTGSSGKIYTLYYDYTDMKIEGAISDAHFMDALEETKQQY